MNIVLTSRLLALPAALIGGALVALILLRLGRRGFSPRLFAVAIACGAMVAFIPAALDAFEARLNLGFAPLWDAALKAFVLAGLGEEGAKLAAAYFFVRADYERRTPRDLILGVASVALGFALLENVLYVFAAADRWPATALTRMITAVPVHALIGLVLGAGLVRADAARGVASRAFLILRAWLVAALLHGAYDLPLFLGLRAPLYPNSVNQIALALSTSPHTLLSVLYLAAVIAICLGAAGVVFRLRAADEPAVVAGFAPRAIWPRWLDRLVFARSTGLALGALVLVPTAVWIGLAVNAALAGVMPKMALDALSICAASAAVGAILLLRASPAAPARPNAWRRRAVAFGALALVAAAIVAFRAPIDAARRDILSYALLVSGNSYVFQGELDQGVANYDAALAYKPDSVTAFFQRALANKTYQRYDRTLDDLNSAVRLAPNDAGILGERAYAFENLHQTDKALADLDRALSIKPDEPALLSLRAEIHLGDGDYDRAAADLDAALKLKPDFALALTTRGDLYLNKLDYDSALGALDEAIRVDPNEAVAYFTRGRVRFLRGEYLAAIADLQQSNMRGPQAYTALWLYLARARAGQNGRDELVFWGSRLSRNAWPFPIVELYVGARSAPATQGAATNNDQLCEAYFYISEWLILQRLDQPATNGLHAAARICPKSFIEANGALGELKRMAPPPAPVPAAPATAETPPPAQTAPVAASPGAGLASAAPVVPAQPAPATAAANTPVSEDPAHSGLTAAPPAPVEAK